jgi:hypothetical protein
VGANDSVLTSVFGVSVSVFVCSDLSESVSDVSVSLSVSVWRLLVVATIESESSSVSLTKIWKLAGETTLLPPSFRV